MAIPLEASKGTKRCDFNVVYNIILTSIVYFMFEFSFTAKRAKWHPSITSVYNYHTHEFHAVYGSANFFRLECYDPNYWFRGEKGANIYMCNIERVQS